MIAAHEGLHFDDSSHTARYRAKLDSLSVGTIVEAILGENGGIPGSTVATRLSSQMDAAFNASKWADSTGGHNNEQLPCSLQFQY